MFRSLSHAILIPSLLLNGIVNKKQNTQQLSTPETRHVETLPALGWGDGELMSTVYATLSWVCFDTREHMGCRETALWQKKQAGWLEELFTRCEID